MSKERKYRSLGESKEGMDEKQSTQDLDDEEVRKEIRKEIRGEMAGWREEIDKGIKNFKERSVLFLENLLENILIENMIEQGEKNRKEKERKVSFKGTQRLDDEEIRKEIRKEIRQEMAGWREEKDKRMKDLEERVLLTENLLENMLIENMRDQREKGRREEEMRNEEGSRAASSKGIGYSSKGSSIISIDRISESSREREIKKINLEKEKEERKNNIIVGGLEVEVTNKKMEDFLKEELGIEVKVKGCRRVSKKVIVVKLENEEKKKDIMRNRNKLKEKHIFIDHDLTWEERKLQKKIFKWAKEEKEKGRFIQVGLASVKIEGKWRKWEEIEKEIIKGEKEEQEVWE